MACWCGHKKTEHKKIHSDWKLKNFLKDCQICGCTQYYGENSYGGRECKKLYGKPSPRNPESLMEGKCPWGHKIVDGKCVIEKKKVR